MRDAFSSPDNWVYGFFGAVASAAMVRQLFPLLLGLLVQVAAGVLTAAVSAVVVWRIKKRLRQIDAAPSLPADPRPNPGAGEDQK